MLILCNHRIQIIKGIKPNKTMKKNLRGKLKFGLDKI